MAGGQRGGTDGEGRNSRLRLVDIPGLWRRVNGLQDACAVRSGRFGSEEEMGYIVLLARLDYGE